MDLLLLALQIQGLANPRSCKSKVLQIQGLAHQANTAARPLVPGGGGNLELAKSVKRRPKIAKEVSMRSCRALLSALFFIGFASCALAGSGRPDGGAANAAPPETLHPVLTGKERLGPKWTDEQRIDNCKVPIDKRGIKPRSSICPDAPPS
jgi:hypothetical protein